jgi:hypothetical protein
MKDNKLEVIEENKFRFTTILDWGTLHEVWEKVREEIFDLPLVFEKDEAITLYQECEEFILIGTTLETLTALYNCIKFINKSKQEL